ncbi:unnamed protein product, partial [Closterium sp. NIES-54]
MSDSGEWTVSLDVSKVTPQVAYADGSTAAAGLGSGGCLPVAPLRSAHQPAMGVGQWGMHNGDWALRWTQQPKR